MLSSSSSFRREKSQKPRNTTTCMSGIYRLISRFYQRRKFLTSSESQKPKQKEDKLVISLPDKNTYLEKCVNRSPTIPPEIRVPQPEEERRKLLEALQKCDEDLNSLKEIIESVRSSGNFEAYSTVNNERNDTWKDNNGCDEMKMGQNGTDLNEEQPSPVSVLDEISSTATSPSSTTAEDGEKNVEKLNKAPFLNKIMTEALPKLRDYKRLHTNSLSSPYCSSYNAKIECVNEIWETCLWEERRELSRIGVDLEDYLFRELIEETVKDLGCCYMYSVLPFDACRRRLCF
ncbi:hypothetical protein GIB67_024732 [Kingdonia uniflora]|uniref:DUF4378 domain-containing protein n=1 Tax=Kingdonia uniflora TaxID=39325 RepID=A0A7J7N9Q3_9MAGN|nr:hypothetical protein GIB67_024732 [Kingdonia uniflora]